MLITAVEAVLYLGVASTVVSRLMRPKQRCEFVPVNPYVLDLPAEGVSFPPQGGTDTYQVRGLYLPYSEALTVVLVCPGSRRPLTDVLGSASTSGRPAIACWPSSTMGIGSWPGAL
jgi:hypothetical protein